MSFRFRAVFALAADIYLLSFVMIKKMAVKPANP